MPRFSAKFISIDVICFGAVVAGAAPAAALYCSSPGLPVGCVGPPAMRAITPGVGAPGVGARPAAGPGVGPNMGGLVNRGGLR